MKLEQIHLRPRTEIVRDLGSDDRDTIVRALLAAALHDSDRRFLEDQIVRFVQHADPWVRSAAATAAGHVARLHGAIDVERVVPLIEQLLTHPETLGKAEDALEDIYGSLADNGNA
jgi:HEAT repeat protein